MEQNVVENSTEEINYEKFFNSPHIGKYVELINKAPSLPDPNQVKNKEFSKAANKLFNHMKHVFSELNGDAILELDEKQIEKYALQHSVQVAIKRYRGNVFVPDQWRDSITLHQICCVLENNQFYIDNGIENIKMRRRTNLGLLNHDKGESIGEINTNGGDVAGKGVTKKMKDEIESLVDEITSKLAIHTIYNGKDSNKDNRIVGFIRVFTSLQRDFDFEHIYEKFEKDHPKEEQSDKEYASEFSEYLLKQVKKLSTRLRQEEPFNLTALEETKTGFKKNSPADKEYKKCKRYVGFIEDKKNPFGIIGKLIEKIAGNKWTILAASQATENQNAVQSVYAEPKYQNIWTGKIFKFACKLFARLEESGHKMSEKKHSLSVTETLSLAKAALDQTYGSAIISLEATAPITDKEQPHKNRDNYNDATIAKIHQEWRNMLALRGGNNGLDENGKIIRDPNDNGIDFHSMLYSKYSQELGRPYKILTSVELKVILETAKRLAIIPQNKEGIAGSINPKTPFSAINLDEKSIAQNPIIEITKEQFNTKANDIYKEMLAENKNLLSEEVSSIIGRVGVVISVANAQEIIEKRSLGR